MTIAFRSGESWSAADGAPEGVGFDVTVPSATNPDKPYRIARQETAPGLEGYIVHTPACPAWRKGHHLCRHVQRAIEFSEDPLRVFAFDVKETWGLACLLGEDARVAFAAAIAQSADQAINQAQALWEYEERQSRPRATVEEAVAVFDRGPEGAARRMGSAMRAVNRRGR